MKLYRAIAALLLTLAFVTASSATVNRQVPNTTTDPSGVAQSVYVDAVSEEVEALWRIGVEPLTSVAGTNTITATPLVSTTGFAAYETGNKFSLIPANSNTGAVTVNIASRGAKAIKTAAGNALSGGELVAGTLYTIEYDGTDFRLAAGGYDLGAGINGASAKSTPVDADEFVISDSAASNAAKKVTLAELKTALGGGLDLVAEDEPTSDVTSVSETGLSAYRDVVISFALQVNTGGLTLSLDGRASGGTWRTLYTSGTFSATGLAIGEVTIRNFGRNNDIKIATGTIFTTFSGGLDRSNANQGGDGDYAIAGTSTYSEQWDEVRLVVSNQTIEGSNSDNRAYVAYYGLGEGD